jgi:hypothetical protein
VAEKLAAQFPNDPEQGMFLALQGSDYLKQALRAQSDLIAKHPTSRQAGIARLLVAGAILNPTADVRTGIYPAARFQEAERLLDKLETGAGLPPLLGLKTMRSLADTLSNAGQNDRAERIRRKAALLFGNDEAVVHEYSSVPIGSADAVLYGPATVRRHWSRNQYKRSKPLWNMDTCWETFLL